MLRLVRIAGLAGLLLATAAEAQSPMAFAPERERPKNLIEMLFGAPRRAPPPTLNIAPPANVPARNVSARPSESLQPAASPARRAAGAGAGGLRRGGGGGSLAVCVRTCDGYFFPINYEGARGTDRFAEACQASCPNAETEVYFKPPGADMDSAANAKGRNYTALPNAFKYRAQRDATCTCKEDGQTWAQALRGAEAMMGARKNDIIVTQEGSDDSIRPAIPATKSGEKLASAGAAEKKPD